MRLPLGEARDVVDRLGAGNPSRGGWALRRPERRGSRAICFRPACRENPFSFGSHFFNSGITPTNGVMAAASQ